MATIRDVAQVAGVSVATVSHVLNGTRYVSPRTVERVRRAVDQTDYVHDTLARTLRRGRSDAVGLVTSALRNPLFIGALRRVDTLLHEHGITLLQLDHDDRPEREMRGVRMLVGWRVDGLIVQPSLDPGPVLEHLAGRDLPVVLLDRKAPERLRDRFDFAGTENVEGSAELVAHLVEHGHRRIGMVSGELSSSTMSERLVGYRTALSRAGLPYDPALVRHVTADVEAAATATVELVGGPRPPSALFAGNDQSCIGVLRGLRAAGLVVPRDIAVVTFDDIPWVDTFEPGLTCVRQQVDRIAETAGELLLSRLGNDRDRAVRHRVLPTELVLRDSCGGHPDMSGRPAPTG